MVAKKPKVKAFEIGAVIPTGPYANIQPKIIVEANSFDEAYAEAMPHIVRVSQDFGQPEVRLEMPGPSVASTAQMETMKCFLTGTEVYFDPIAHAYVDAQGNQYISGSKFAKQFEHEFDARTILPAYCKKHSVSEEEVEEMWADKGLASTDFGTAVHRAMEVYLRHYHLNNKCHKDPLDMVHPLLRPVVASFFTDQRLEPGRMKPEVFLADKVRLRCGQLDLVEIVDEKAKIMDIHDYKTNVDLFKQGQPKNLKPPFAALPNMPAGGYTLQLSFYKKIAEAAGWTVRGIYLHQLIETKEGWGWKQIKLSAVDIDQKRIDLSKVQ